MRGPSRRVGRTVTQYRETPVPLDVVGQVNQFVEACHVGARTYANVTLLDESQMYDLHLTAASIYARGWTDGAQAASLRESARRSRERDRVNEEAAEAAS